LANFGPPAYPPHPPDGPSSRTTTLAHTHSILAQSLTSATRFPYCDRQSLKWRYRRVSLLKEMLSLNADVLCLQELDNYDEWWRGKMGLAGYDGVYLAHQGENRRDGLAVFYKRDLFQLFRTEEVYFNDLAPDFANPARAMTGHVALMLGLQPWEESVHASAMCITCTQVSTLQRCCSCPCSASCCSCCAL
jgi:hypothetical protein